ncbi:MAG: glycosyltransferase [Saprospiraceae bacterium]
MASWRDDHSNPAMVREEDLCFGQKNKTVIYHGFKDDIKKYISLSDCIVLPSYREGMSRSITEGMSMGKPIITTDTAGCREAIENNIHGYIVPIKDIDNLALAMENYHYAIRSKNGNGQCRKNQGCKRI